MNFKFPAPTDFNYELFFEFSPDLLCIAGFDGYFKKVNTAVMTTLGYTLEELYARPINDFVYHDDKEITASVRNELTKAKPLHNFENRYVTKSGDIVWLSWTSMPFEDDRLIFAIAKDITHKKNIELGRNELLVSLTQMNHDLKHLSYMTSHDLRSPVNNLLSVYNLLDVTKIMDEETVELIEFLKISTEKLKLSLNNYVDVISDKHDGNANMETVHFSKVLPKVMEAVDTLIRSSKATIRTDFSSSDAIRFNETYLYSIFLNLITNSIKYSKPDSEPLISIQSDKIDGFTRLVFEDNGMGFDPDQVRSRIFGLHQKFDQLSDSKGVGLYLVHNHVTALGGKMDIESTIDHGTRFTILFRDPQ
jgi:PAS domain S-box-containing protein